VVLEKLEPIEREVTTLKDGRSFIMRVLPYRTTDGRIDGVVVTLIDITELRKAEESIRSAALFPLENPAPVLRIGRDGSLLFSNRSSEPMLDKWRADYGKEVPDQLLQTIESALADGVAREIDFAINGRDISFVVAPIPDRSYVNLYGRDVTLRKQAEESLRRAKEEWERTFASVPDLIAILDNEHRVLRVNEAMARQLGLKPEECVGLSCYEVIHGLPEPPEFCPHTRTFRDGREHVEEVHEERLGGDFLVSTTPLHDEQGLMIGSVHVAHDITLRKQMEDALRESAARLNRSQEIAHLGSWELDLSKNELIWSEETYRIFGLQPQEFSTTYEAFLEAVHPEDRMAVDAAYSGSLNEGGDTFEIEHRIVKKSTGDIRIVHEKCEHFRDASGRIVRSVGMVHDITEQKRAEEEILRQVGELRAANEELERFNKASVGRELRMVELKREVNELCYRIGVPQRYPLDFGEEPGGG
jgi:PAS domain S-box-containing protein